MAVSGGVQQFWKTLVNGNGFDQCLKKINILSAGNGECKAEMTVSEEHTNRSGTLHGGMTSTIVDILSGIALSTHHKNSAIGVSVDLNISFLKGVKIGEQIVIEAKTNKAGKTLAFLDVYIKNKSGEIVATGSHTKYVAM